MIYYRIFDLFIRLNLSNDQQGKTTPMRNFSDADWKKKLTKEQYRMLRQKDTEYPGTGKYDKHFEKGIYQCAGCGTDLYE